jgi:hypothetical protein
MQAQPQPNLVCVHPHHYLHKLNKCINPQHKHEVRDPLVIAL